MKAAIGFVFILACAASTDAATILQCGRFVDVRAGRVAGNTTIVVDGTTIAKVEQGFVATSANDSVIDLRAQTCIPGLIDMHVHLTGEYSESSEIDSFRLNPADYALQSVV